MQWIICRYKIITHTMGMQFFLFSMLISSVIAKADWAYKKCIEFKICNASEEAMIFGFPSEIIGALAILAFLYWKSLNYIEKLENESKKSNKTNQYAQAVGILYSDILKSEKKEVVSKTANPSRAYNSYWKLENYKNSLPSNSVNYKKLNKFLSHFETNSYQIHGVIIGSSIKLKRNIKVPKNIEKTVNYLKEEI